MYYKKGADIRRNGKEGKRERGWEESFVKLHTARLSEIVTKAVIRSVPTPDMALPLRHGTRGRYPHTHTDSITSDYLCI